MKASIASLVGSRISACGSKGLASRQCFSVGRPFLRGDFDIVLAGGVERVGVPAQRLGFVDRALHVVAERSGPVDGEVRAQFVTDIDGIAHAELGVLADLRGFGGRTGGPHGVMKRLGRDHRTFHAVFVQRLFDAGDDLRLGGRCRCASVGITSVSCVVQ